MSATLTEKKDLLEKRKQAMVRIRPSKGKNFSEGNEATCKQGARSLISLVIINSAGGKWVAICRIWAVNPF